MLGTHRFKRVIMKSDTNVYRTKNGATTVPFGEPKHVL